MRWGIVPPWGRPVGYRVPSSGENRLQQLMRLGIRYFFGSGHFLGSDQLVISQSSSRVVRQGLMLMFVFGSRLGSRQQAWILTTSLGLSSGFEGRLQVVGRSRIVGDERVAESSGASDFVGASVQLRLRGWQQNQRRSSVMAALFRI